MTAIKTTTTPTTIKTTTTQHSSFAIIKRKLKESGEICNDNERKTTTFVNHHELYKNP